MVDGLPSTVQVHVHRDRVTALDDSDDGVQWVRTEGGLNLAADAVVLTLGHVGAEPAGDTAALLDWCRGQGLPALGPDHGVDVDLTAFTAAHRVLVRGLGLAFVDLLILLTEGRGGRFVEVEGGGDVRYQPSGAEPQLLVGSRRGVPYQCKPTDQVRRGSLDLLRFFSDDVVSGLLEGHKPLEFRRDVWPLIAKEACWGFYQQLHASQPDRLSLPWEEFVTRFAEVDWGAPAFDQFIATAVPSEEDRLDLQALAEPLAGRRFADQASLQRWITERSRGDLARCTDPRRSAELGAFFALLECFPGLARVLASPRLDPRATLDEFEGWWFLLFSSFASGPPPARLRQLLALANAGVVRFIGAGLQVHPDAAAGILRATTDSVPEVFEADAFIDARHPGPSATLATDGLLRTLVATRAASEATVADGEQRRSTGRLRVGAGGRVVDRDGRPHPRRLALGPHTVARAPAFARPGCDAPAFRQNDAAARALLDLGPVLGPRALDNAVWHALARSLWRFAHWSGRSARFTPEVSVFAAVPDEPSSDDWRALARLVGPGGTAVLFRDQVDEPDGWTSLAEIPGVQMDGTGAEAAVSVEVALLGEADLDEMVSLAARTRPGPFARRTPELGRYYGVRREGELVAMAGERLRLPGRTEISAVCTHQAHRGRGSHRSSCATPSPRSAPGATSRSCTPQPTTRTPSRSTRSSGSRCGARSPQSPCEHRARGRGTDMPVEFLGMGATNDGSEIRRRTGPAFDLDYTIRLARAHEEHGWDRVLTAYGSGTPDPAQAAAAIALRTERLEVLVAHRPNLSIPTFAAKTIATLDQLSGGRTTIHLITGGNDREQRREGDYLAKDERYLRTREYLQILKLAWTEHEPFDHHGRFYRFVGFVSDVFPVQQPRPRISFGGSSDAAYTVGAKEADIYCLWGEPLADTAQQIGRIRDLALVSGRTSLPKIQVAFRPIIAPTEAKAWEKAEDIVSRIEARQGPNNPWMQSDPKRRPENTGSQRLLDIAARGERFDRALWTRTAAATGAVGNSNALVGTPDTVAAALLDYVDLGVDILSARGYDLLQDAIDFGREVIPLVREEVHKRDQAALAEARA